MGFGLTLRIYCDYGMENTGVAWCMLERGELKRHGAGRSVHNQRIERLRAELNSSVVPLQQPLYLYGKWGQTRFYRWTPSVLPSLHLFAKISEGNYRVPKSVEQPWIIYTWECKLLCNCGGEGFLTLPALVTWCHFCKEWDLWHQWVHPSPESENNSYSSKLLHCKSNSSEQSWR